MKHKYFLIILIGAVMLNSCKSAGSSLDEMLGQMLLIGFYGMDAKPDTHIARAIKQYHLGGVILFDYNPVEKNHDRNIQSKEQIIRLNRQLQSCSEKPLFIAVDQEGGLVSRLKPPYGYTRPYSAEYIGEIDNPDTTRSWASEIANQLAESGFNLNFAPVVDIAVNPECPVIAKLHRSFSSDPEKVVEHASLFIEELHKRKIVTAIKHFPGHGSSLNDSHEGFTDVSATWTETELIPFRKLISLNLPDMIMTAHIYNSQIDSLYPATLSDKSLDGLLREKLGWRGIVVSDCLYMKAIHANYSLEETIEQAVNSGVDILLFASPDPEENIAREAFTTLKQLVKSGKISRERIEEAYKRIDTLKNKLKQ